ncbi:MAG TPA: 50S ribosomal protein L10 [Candidatus Omnitrophota bacterium]|nr:50S ribosomal protein L10 [Candidatus Omnitrophota bacterium]HQL41207.1 50S ribosomal protein L10 [Candidatus Omnitrophota bacterium]
MKKVGRLIRESVSEKIRQNVKDRGTTFLFSYDKMSSPKMSDVRKALSAVGAKVYVSKNRVAKKALEEIKFSSLIGDVKSQVAFVWSDKDSVEIAKVLVKISKANEAVNIRGGVLDGKTVAQNDIQRLSDLPSRDVLLTMLAQSIQSPLSRLLNALNANTRDLIYILKQLSDKSASGSSGDKSS